MINRTDLLPYIEKLTDTFNGWFLLKNSKTGHYITNMLLADYSDESTYKYFNQELTKENRINQLVFEYLSNYSEKYVEYSVPIGHEVELLYNADLLVKLIIEHEIQLLKDSYDYKETTKQDFLIKELTELSKLDSISKILYGDFFGDHFVYIESSEDIDQLKIDLYVKSLTLYPDSVTCFCDEEAIEDTTIIYSYP